MRWQAGFAFFVIGAGTGWLAGLAMSPTIQSILGAVLGIAGTTVAAAAGIRLEGSRLLLKEVNPWPLVLLIVGLAISAPVGVVAREHRWLGRRTVPVTDGVKHDLKSQESPSQRPQEGAGIGLYATFPPGHCHDLRTFEGDRLRLGFQTSENKILRLIGEHVQERSALESIRDLACPKP